MKNLVFGLGFAVLLIGCNTSVLTSSTEKVERMFGPFHLECYTLNELSVEAARTDGAKTGCWCAIKYNPTELITDISPYRFDLVFDQFCDKNLSDKELMDGLPSIRAPYKQLQQPQE